MATRASRILDGRGELRAVARGDEILRSGLSRGRQREIQRITKLEFRWRARLGMSLLGVFGLIFVLLLSLQLGFALSGPRIVSGEADTFDRVADVVESVFVPVAVGSLAMMSVGAVFFGRGYVRARGRALVRLELCACCLYELGGLSEAEDGCVVCPECGSAWRLIGTEVPYEG